jgi:hypothetical protein
MNKKGLAVVSKNCTQTDFSASKISCMCPMSNAAITCAPNYCGNYDETCLRKFMDYSDVCPTQITSLPMYVGGATSTAQAAKTLSGIVSPSAVPGATSAAKIAITTALAETTAVKTMNSTTSTEMAGSTMTSNGIKPDMFLAVLFNILVLLAL